MADKTAGEKFDDLEKVVTTLVARADLDRVKLDDLRTEARELTETLAEMKAILSVLGKGMQGAPNVPMNAGASKPSSTLLPSILGAVVGGVIAAVVWYFLVRK